MKILVHKDLDINLDAALAYLRNEKPLPYDVALNLLEGAAIFETMDSYNLLGEITDEYNVLFYEE